MLEYLAIAPQNVEIKSDPNLGEGTEHDELLEALSLMLKALGKVQSIRGNGQRIFYESFGRQPG